MSIVNVQALKGLNCILYWPGSTAVGGVYDDDGNKRGFLILPDGVTVTPTGTFAVEKMKDGRNVWKFDGSTNYITISDHASWSMFLNDFTICWWINYSSMAAHRVLLGQYVDASNYWYISWGVNTNKLYLIGLIGGVSTFSYNIDITPVVNTHYHISIVKSGSTCKFYINGIQQTVNITTAFTGTTHVASSLVIGYMNAVYHAGNIKDLMIFKGKALSQDQIAAIMAETYIY